jgi:hypothetical protein
MTPQECAAALTYANQIDPRVQLNDATLDVWENALAHADSTQVRWIIKEHYSSGVNANEAHQPMITAALVRRRITDETNRAAASRSALEAGPRVKNYTALRQNNPGMWDALVEAGAEHRRLMLTEQGEADPYRHGILPEGHSLKTWTR